MTIKRLMVLFICVIMMLSCTIAAYAQETPEPEVTVFVDGEQIIFDVNPILENGRTLVPMRYIFEALGADVNWIDETSTAVAIRGETKIEITVDSNQMLRNDEIIVLDVPAKLHNDRTLVPVRAVSEGLGAKVDWDEELFRVIISSPVDSGEVKSEETQKSGNTYDMSELSEKDMELLKSSYGQLRYSFEQEGIPYNIAELADINWNKVFNDKAVELPAFIEEIWNMGMVGVVVDIQLNSDDSYVISSLTEEQMIDSYLAIVEKADLKADDIFETSYVTTPAGKNVLLITFKETDTLLACKYAAIVADGNTARYFTAETDAFLAEMGKEAYFLCEVTTEGRSNFGTIGTDEKSFLKGIDSQLR